MKIKYEKVFSFYNASLLYSSKNLKDKLSYAINRVSKQFEQAIKEYRYLVEDIDIDNCVTDDKGIILRDGSGLLSFTKEGRKKANEEIRALMNKEVEIEPFICKDIPELSDLEKEIFTGIVI